MWVSGQLRSGTPSEGNRRARLPGVEEGRRQGRSEGAAHRARCGPPRGEHGRALSDALGLRRAGGSGKEAREAAQAPLPRSEEHRLPRPLFTTLLADRSSCSGNQLF